MYNKSHIISVFLTYLTPKRFLTCIHQSISATVNSMSSCGSFVMNSAYGSNSTLVQQANCCATSRHYSQRIHLSDFLHSVHMPKRPAAPTSDSERSLQTAL